MLFDGWIPYKLQQPPSPLPRVPASLPFTMECTVELRILGYTCQPYLLSYVYVREEALY